MFLPLAMCLVSVSQSLQLTTEEEFLRSGNVSDPQDLLCNVSNSSDINCTVSDSPNASKISDLSNTFPTTTLRKGLQSQEGITSHKKIERTSSEHKLYPTPLHRMSSKDYENTELPNEAVSAKEASSMSKPGDEVCVRYSGSSTDNGEFKLNLETQKDVKDL